MKWKKINKKIKFKKRTNKDIKCYIKFSDSIRSTSTSLLNLIDNFSDRFHQKDVMNVEKDVKMYKWSY